MIAAGIKFSSTTALRFADLEGLPSNNTMGPVNARPLQDVKLNHDEGNRAERPGRFLITRAPIGQHVKMFRQLKTPPGHVKESVYPKQVNQECDVQGYGGLKAVKKDETSFAAYDKAEMRKAKIMIVAKARYRLSDLLRAKRNDRMTSNLKRWIENGSPDKGDLEEDSYRILR